MSLRMSTDIIKRYFPNLSEAQMAQYEKLAPLYEDWNSKINIISRKDMDNFYEHHVLHSLAIAKYFELLPGMKVLDIGTGGGFPALSFAFSSLARGREWVRAPLRVKKYGRFRSVAPFGYNLFTNLRYNRIDAKRNVPGARTRDAIRKEKPRHDRKDETDLPDLPGGDPAADGGGRRFADDRSVLGGV